jgi:hypothetical protein
LLIALVTVTKISSDVIHQLLLSRKYSFHLS